MDRFAARHWMYMISICGVQVVLKYQDYRGYPCCSFPINDSWLPQAPLLAAGATKTRNVFVSIVLRRKGKSIPVPRCLFQKIYGMLP